MIALSQELIQNHVADSSLIFQRGRRLYEYGAYLCTEAAPDAGRFVYEVDGSFGDYTTRIDILDQTLRTQCDCPYPGRGCKHAVAALLDIYDRMRARPAPEAVKTADAPEAALPAYLTADEIRRQALEDRKKRAENETFKLIPGDMVKGEHLVETPLGKAYVVTLHDPVNSAGHCSCPDYLTNRLGICKHLIFACRALKAESDFQDRVAREKFPFVDIYWDSAADRPRMFCERPEAEIAEVLPVLTEYFGPDGAYLKPDPADITPLLSKVYGVKRVRVREAVIDRADELQLDRELEAAEQADAFPPLDLIRTRLYPYQLEGVKFGLYKRGVLIGDEMGLGKTLQAIVLAVMKREIFGLEKVLVVTLASLKEQWKREIEKFTDETAAVIAGTRAQRQALYMGGRQFFKITNYEAVLRDVTVISRYKPDLIILDEAQRIKNFNTKTADAAKNLPRKHAVVLTGTPLENKLEDVYSIVQFLRPRMLSPLWQFAADHFMLSRDKKGKILGYRNLDRLHERLKSIVIRRKKEDVLSDLPDEIVNNYYLDMADQQRKIHAGYLQSLLPLLNKKFITPMDLRRIMELLLCMRRVCDSTFLIDRKTHISPKLKELESILDDLVLQSGRKVVIFSEWTAMTFLIAKQLSDAGISFVELSGKIPVHKRQALIDEFTNNPDCKAFLSTDAGGTGLNLQAGDCVINFELPWNPAKMNQRIGRVNRIGQKSRCVNVINLIMKQSIEEKILAGIQLKTDLFQGVFDGTVDQVEFSREKRTEMVNKLREMMGEDPEPVVAEQRLSEEIPEDTPHYLNPEVLNPEAEREEAAADGRVAYDAEESRSEAEETTPPVDQAVSGYAAGTLADARAAAPPAGASAGGDIFAGQPPEKLETVLNSGMSFISGLLEMATGRKAEPAAGDERMIRIDRETGEVVMKFKLPGF